MDCWCKINLQYIFNQTALYPPHKTWRMLTEWAIILAAHYISLTLFITALHFISIVWKISDQNAHKSGGRYPTRSAFFTGSQLPGLPVLGNPDSELCGLSWCKQMVSALMTNFWSHPDRDSKLYGGETTATGWNMRSVNKGPSPISWKNLYLDNHNQPVWRVNSSTHGFVNV